MSAFARDKEAVSSLGITSKPTRLPDLGAPLDAAVCDMVLMAIPNRLASRPRVRGLFVFVMVHPAVEGLWATWRRHDEHRVPRYLEDEIPVPAPGSTSTGRCRRTHRVGIRGLPSV